MLLNKTELLLTLISLINLVSSTSEINAQIDFKVHGNGFHREVNYEVNLNNLTSENCYVALYLELPSAIYVNVDELSNLQRFEKFTTCSEGETNVELFAEDANSQQVTICSLLDRGINHFSLPLHERYLRAGDSQDYVNITLPNPKLLLGCPTRLRSLRVSSVDLCKPCVDFAKKWREVPYKQGGEDYIWRMPIGNVSDRYQVVIITLITSVLGAVAILKALYR